MHVIFNNDILVLRLYLTEEYQCIVILFYDPILVHFLILFVLDDLLDYEGFRIFWWADHFVITPNFFIVFHNWVIFLGLLKRLLVIVQTFHINRLLIGNAIIVAPKGRSSPSKWWSTRLHSQVRRLTGLISRGTFSLIEQTRVFERHRHWSRLIIVRNLVCQRPKTGVAIIVRNLLEILLRRFIVIFLLVFILLLILFMVLDLILLEINKVIWVLMDQLLLDVYILILLLF